MFVWVSCITFRLSAKRKQINDEARKKNAVLFFFLFIPFWSLHRDQWHKVQHYYKKIASSLQLSAFQSVVEKRQDWNGKKMKRVKIIAKSLIETSRNGISTTVRWYRDWKLFAFICHCLLMWYLVHFEKKCSNQFYTHILTFSHCFAVGIVYILWMGSFGGEFGFFHFCGPLFCWQCEREKRRRCKCVLLFLLVFESIKIYQ